jgi:hypothetical protein
MQQTKTFDKLPKSGNALPAMLPTTYREARPAAASAAGQGEARCSGASAAPV